MGRKMDTQVNQANMTGQNEAQYDTNQMVVVRKANEFVNASYRFGNNDVLCQQLIVISLTRLQKEGSQLKSVLYPAEIKKLMGRTTDRNIYKRLKNASASLSGHVITIEDSQHLTFRTFSLITNAEYEHGRLQIYYNKEMTPYIYNLQRGYTKYELGILCALDRSSSFRLYELLEKEVYLFKEKKAKVITKTYNLSELKSKIGLVNTDEPYIKKMVAEGKSWDEILENTKKEDQMYTSWTDFRKRILDPAQQELKEKTDIAFEYEPIRGDRGGKVISILFQLRQNTASRAQKIILEQKLREESTSSVSVNARIMNEAQTYYAAEQILEDCGYNNVADFTAEYFDQLYERCGKNLDTLKKLVEAASQLKVPGKRLSSWLMRSIESDLGPSEDDTERVIDMDPETIIDAEMNDRGYDEIRGYLKESGIRNLAPFTAVYFEDLLEDAGGDVEEIRKAIRYGKSQKRIRNYFGWLRKAVREKYADTETVEAENGSTDDAEMAKAMRSSVNDKIKQTVWKRFTTQEYFPQFLDTTGVDLPILEATFSIDERISMYSEFLRGLGIEEK